MRMRRRKMTSAGLRSQACVLSSGDVSTSHRGSHHARSEDTREMNFMAK
jgi:hypothetical protein